MPAPTIAIFFSGTYGGDTLVAVPSTSLLEESTFKLAFDELANKALGTIGSLLDVGAFFIGSLQTIKDAFDSGVTTLKFKKADSLDLHDVVFAGASSTGTARTATTISPR